MDEKSTPGSGSGPSGEAAASVPTVETDRLISSSKVEGTAVYNTHGERLGTVSNFMVDKFTGQVAYAVMSFGGFLRLGDAYYPLPWKVLTYDTGKGGTFSISTGASSKARQATSRAKSLTGLIRPLAGASTTTTTCHSTSGLISSRHSWPERTRAGSSLEEKR